MTLDAPQSAFRYRAFISYSHRDKVWADWLHKALETYAIPSRLVGQTTAAGVIPRRLAPIFRDRDELASATDLGGKVNGALAQSANLIVICSPRSATSRWVQDEVLAYKRLGRSEHIFCLIVDGEPNASDLPGREAEECFAHALRYRLGSDNALSHQRTEPIAADARPGQDGKSNAKLKLIAGLLDVGFDQLKQRELQRRNRRLAAVAALAVAVMAVTTTLAIMALIARHAAVVASQAAVRRQKQAEGLVGFMLGDLNDKLAQVSRLDIMEAVDDKAMAYFESLPTTDVTDEALALRVTALQKIGAVHQNQGKLDKALESYRAASRLAAELLQHAPADLTRQADYANSLSWIGMVYWLQGNLEPAAQNFRAAGDLLGKAVTQSPSNTKLVDQLSSALINTGRILEARGNFSAASPYFETARDHYARLRKREPANPQWQLELAYAYNDLGKMALEQGHIDDAISAYRADQHLKTNLAVADPNNHDAQEGLLVSHAILGRTLALCGQMQAAVHFTELAVASARVLTAFDRTNTSWQDYVALYSQQLGGLMRQQGQLATAAATDDDAVHALSAMAAKDPTNASLRQDLAQSQLEQARVQLARNEIDAAATSVRAVQAALEKLRQGNASDRSLILLATQAYLVSGQVADGRDDAAAAMRFWTQARDTILPATNSGADPNFLAVYAEALVRLDDVSAAEPLIARLNAMGYRTPDFVALAMARKLAYPANPEFSRRLVQVMQSDAALPPTQTTAASTLSASPGKAAADDHRPGKN